MPENARFCPQCAHPVAAAAAPAPTVPVPAAREPLSYTPKHLADKILQSKSALEGERKQVTVLFADVKGSMELAEQLDPESIGRTSSVLAQCPSLGVMSSPIGGLRRA